MLIAPHTDVGVVTILSCDNGTTESSKYFATKIPVGLDVLPTEGTLGNGLDVEFIINVGDCLSDFSLGLLKSTLHRVGSNL